YVQLFFKYILSGLFLFFFFSSRRRHTRSKRDWSSDVCSSDLGRGCKLLKKGTNLLENYFLRSVLLISEALISVTWFILIQLNGRSEERRVGKECRYRGGT